MTVHIYVYLNNTKIKIIINCLNSWEAHVLYSATMLPKISGSFVLRERSGFLQLLSQGKIILRLTESLEFLLITTGGIV